MTSSLGTGGREFESRRSGQYLAGMTASGLQALATRSPRLGLPQEFAEIGLMQRGEAVVR